MWSEFNCFSEHFDENFRSTKGEKYLKQLRDYQLLNMTSVLWSCFPGLQFNIECLTFIVIEAATYINQRVRLL